MKAISHLTYELSVLAKAVSHRNLSLAAEHIGLSQPQLSRLIQKLETELKVVLLDRSSRRKSGWTPTALELVAAFQRGLGRLESEILAVTEQTEVTELRIGTLEGLAPIAMELTHNLFHNMAVHRVELDVFDYSEMDSLFMSGQLDLILTARQPSKQKFKYLIEIGYQQIEKISKDRNFLVLSPFEKAQAQNLETHTFTHMLVSNSLNVRATWLKEYGGTGMLPVNAKKGKGKGHYSVYLIGHDLLAPSVWEQISDTAEI